MSTEETSESATEALWRLAETDRIDLVESLLEEGADVNASNEHGMTVLMRAAANGRPQMVSVLLTHGADPNVSRNDKFTPLLLASFFGHEEIVKLLVEHGADTGAKSRFDTSAQMWASCRNFFDVAEYLEQPLTTDVAGMSDVEPNEPRAAVESEIPRPAQISESAEESETAKVSYVEPLGVHGRKTVPSAFSLKWALAGFMSAFLLVAVVVVTDRAMRDEYSKPVPAQNQSSPGVPVDHSHFPQTSGDINLPNTKSVEISAEADGLLRKQNELKAKRVLRGEVATAESTATPKPEKENTGTKVSLPERAEEETRPTEPPANASKQTASARDRIATTPPTPSTTQLLTGAKSGPPTGKVIRWP